MNENDDLQILIQTAFDIEKSLNTMRLQLEEMRQKFKNYQLKITAGLDREATSAQIQSDLKRLAKGRVQLTGKMDQKATKAEVDATLKRLKNTEIKIRGILDANTTAADIQKQLTHIPSVKAKADVEVNGAEQINDLSGKMEKASTGAAGMAANLYLARTALQAVRKAAQEAAQTIVELDKAATDLAIVAGNGSEEAYKLLAEYNDLAKQLGATTTQVSDAATEWLRQGKTAAETTALIEQSMILSKVGAMDAETATKNLTSAMKGYGLAVEDVSGIVDKLTAIDLKAAVTASDLAVAMSRTANSANISGVSMDRLLGYLAAVEEVTQKSAETIGESFKTVFARMGNIKIGNYLDDEGEDLSDVETVLKSFGIALRNSEGDFRNFSSVLDDVYAKWSQFGAIDKRAIANAFAGTRQQENFLVLMENYGKALDYAGVAADSAGTSLEKFAAYEDSIEAKSAKFTAAMESLAMNTVNPAFVKDAIDTGTALIELAEKADLLKASLVGLGAGAALKGVTKLSEEFIDVKNNVVNLGTAMETLQNAQKAGGFGADTLQRIGTLTKSLNDEQVKLVLSSQNLTVAQMESILTASGLTTAEAKQKLETLGLAASQATATASTVSFSAAMTGLGTAIKAAFASNPIGMTMLAVSAVYATVKGISAIIDATTVSTEQLNEEYQQGLEDLKDLESQLDSTMSKIDELNQLRKAGDMTEEQEAELSRLKEQNELLSAEIAMQKELNSLKQAEINDRAVTAADAFFSGEEATQDAWGVTIGEDSGIVKLNRAEEAYRKAKADYLAEVQKGAEANTATLERLKNEKKSALEAINARFEELQSLREGLNQDDPNNSDRIKQIDDTIKSIAELVGATDSLTASYGKNTSAAGDFSESADAGAKSAENLADKVKTLADNYDLLRSAQEEFNTSGGFTANTLKSIVEKFPDLADNVDDYISGMKTGKELLADLSTAYQTDADNYKQSVAKKLAASPEFYNNLSEKQKALIDDLADSYGVDLDNFKDLESKKLEFQAQIIARLASNYAKYTGATVSELKSALVGIQSQIKWIDDGPSKNALLAEEKSLLETLGALDKMQRAVDELTLDSSVWTPGKYDSGSSSKSSKAVEAYVADIEKYRDALKRLNDVQEEAAAIQEKMDNSQDVREQILLQKQLIGVYGQEQEALSTLNKLRDQTITENVKKLRSLGFAVQYNAESDELWISNMERLNQLTATSKGKYETLQEATNALRKDTEELIKTTEEMNDANRDGSSDWNALSYSIRDAKDHVFELLDTIVQNASDAVDSIQSVYDTLHDAAEEYAESGFIAIDTIQSIKDLGMEYLSYLQDENGQLVINEKAVRKIIAAKTEQMAVQSALSYVEALSIAKRDSDIETLNRLLTATTETTDATWGLVYAQLKYAGLSDDEYKAALANINALRAMAESAITSIGKVSGKVKSELEDMQSGVNDILEYVMDMLKQKIDNQVEALEDMKTQYADIISEQKESLELARQEADHKKDMASKMKQIAKLQAQIDILSLDNSRDAQAKRASLMEELADLQNELADSQADYALEAQEESLDKMQEAYEQEKDDEIEALKDSISSTQKLYDKAIDYIGDNWDSLYRDLIDWNTEYGSNLNDDITSAWDNCLAAAQKYGSYVAALNNLPGDIEAAGSGSNLNLGNTVYGDSSTTEEQIHAIIKKMYANMNEHGGASSSTSPERKAQLSQENLRLGNELHQFGIMAYRSIDKEDYGTWYTDSTKRQKLFDAYSKYIYHEGGFAGEDGTLRDNEILAKLEKGEPVLTTKMWDTVLAMVENVGKLTDAFSQTSPIGNYDLTSFFKFGASGAGGNATTNNVTNSSITNNRPVEINIGGPTIQGAVMGYKELAENLSKYPHQLITRDMANEIGRLLGGRR